MPHNPVPDYELHTRKVLAIGSWGAKNLLFMYKAQMYVQYVNRYVEYLQYCNFMGNIFLKIFWGGRSKGRV